MCSSASHLDSPYPQLFNHICHFPLSLLKFILLFLISRKGISFLGRACRGNSSLKYLDSCIVIRIKFILNFQICNMMASQNLKSQLLTRVNYPDRLQHMGTRSNKRQMQSLWWQLMCWVLVLYSWLFFMSIISLYY